MRRHWLLDHVDPRETLSGRESKILTLLSLYVDVEYGWQEGGKGAGEFGKEMLCRMYKHPSFVELRRVLPALRDERNAVYWHVREAFQAPSRSVLMCPRCKATEPIASKHFKYTHDGRHVTLKHKHGGESVFFVLDSVPAVSAAVRPEVVLDGVRWISVRFRGEPFIPDELLAKERAA